MWLEWCLHFSDRWYYYCSAQSCDQISICVSFAKCITRIDETKIDDAENLDLLMLMYNLLEYSSNYSGTTGSLWFYYQDEATDFNANIQDNNNFKCFTYKGKLLGNSKADKK